MTEPKGSFDNPPLHPKFAVGVKSESSLLEDCVLFNSGDDLNLSYQHNM